MSVEVKQIDRDAAATSVLRKLEQSHGGYQAWMFTAVQPIRDGEQDDHWDVQAFAAHRHQAEEAMRERAAAYVEGKGDVIPGATVFIPLITGDRMPCMSGDGRDKLLPHKRRQFDDATRDLAAAIRSIDTRGE